MRNLRRLTLFLIVYISDPGECANIENDTVTDVLDIPQFFEILGEYVTAEIEFHVREDYYSYLFEVEDTGSDQGDPDHASDRKNNNRNGNGMEGRSPLFITVSFPYVFTDLEPLNMNRILCIGRYPSECLHC